MLSPTAASPLGKRVKPWPKDLFCGTRQTFYEFMLFGFHSTSYGSPTLPLPDWLGLTGVVISAMHIRNARQIRQYSQEKRMREWEGGRKEWPSLTTLSKTASKRNIKIQQISFKMPRDLTHFLIEIPMWYFEETEKCSYDSLRQESPHKYPKQFW